MDSRHAAVRNFGLSVCPTMAEASFRASFTAAPAPAFQPHKWQDRLGYDLRLSVGTTQKAGVSHRGHRGHRVWDATRISTTG